MNDDNFTVILIDDVPQIVAMLAEYLDYAGFRTRTITSNFERLLADDSIWENVDAALIDFWLGGPITGEHILEHLHTHHPHIRRVVLSASGVANDRVRYLADACLDKPASLPRIAAVLRGEPDHG